MSLSHSLTIDFTRGPDDLLSNMHRFMVVHMIENERDIHGIQTVYWLEEDREAIVFFTDIPSKRQFHDLAQPFSLDLDALLAAKLEQDELKRRRAMLAYVSAKIAPPVSSEAPDTFQATMSPRSLFTRLSDALRAFWVAFG